MGGVKTNVVTAVEITGRHAAERLTSNPLWKPRGRTS